MTPPIFITGTGRSGTWVLYKIIGSHPKIHAFPREMRFLVDPDGLHDLVDDLTINFHPVQARETLYRFERLMRVYMTNPDDPPYKGFDLPDWFGGDFYWDKLEKFSSSLVDAEFIGKTWQLEPTHEGRIVSLARMVSGIKSSSKEVDTRRAVHRDSLKVVKYFSDRSELTRLAAGFVDELFRWAAREAGKETWCEKTPQHLLILDFIWELFPDSVVIHIKRDPRGVVQSLTKQKWAPTDLRSACLFLRPVYQRWRDLKSEIALPPDRYVEFHLEEFAVNPDPVLDQIARACEIENSFDGFAELSLEKVDYWKKSMSDDEIEMVNDLMGPEISFMGYSI